MAKAVTMPKFGFTHEESEIVCWLVQEGDRVEKGDPLAEVTTDKIDMEIESPASGILGGVKFPAGAHVPVTQVIAYILEPGEQPPAEAPDGPVLAAQERAVQQRAVKPGDGAAQDESVHSSPLAQRVAQSLGVDLTGVAGSGPKGRVMRKDVERLAAPEGKVRATPAARRAAREGGVSLVDLAGSGPRGRVQEADVQHLRAQPQASPPAVQPEAGDGIRRVPFVGMRRTIAANMAYSARELPHITFEVSVDVKAAEELRAQANARLPEGQAKVSLTAIIAKATAWTLNRHPWINSRLEGDEILLLPSVHLGIAVALEEGLIVPVIQNAEGKGIYLLAQEIQDLSLRAKNAKLRAEQLTGGTFTISNLGMYGINKFTAIINPPQVAILAVGGIQQMFVPDGEGRSVLASHLNLTLSVDHRVVDGSVAARFLKDLKDALERPVDMLL